MRSAVNFPKTVTLCTSAAAFSENQILKREVAEKYPGALWVPELVDKLTSHGISTVTGDVALRQVKAGKLNPSELWVIQEDRSSDADELIRLGAKGKVLLCFESPLFAANFYRDLATVSRRFEHCVVFRGALKDAFPLIDAYAMYFPSFDSTKSSQTISWEARKNLVMVAGNKYWKIRRSLIRNVAAKVRDIVRHNPERFSKKYSSTQLHDRRLAAMSHFGRRGKLDLFGGGWDSLQNLPLRWQNELSGIVSDLKPKPCANKLATIANYKFALCFENIEFPGYVTEKLIDCLAAGVVPIYWGAPDIHNFIPEDCFIDARKFETLDDLDNYLENFSNKDAQNFLDCSNSFLSGKKGRRYSYEGFAGEIESILMCQT